MPYPCHSMMGWELLKNKGGSISFQNPFLLCPSSLWLGIRTQSVLGTCITNFHFRFSLHRINYCIVLFEYFFNHYCWLNMTKTAWNCKIWWTSESEGQHDPDWTQIWTLGAWPTPKSGFKLGFFPRLLVLTWIWSNLLIIPAQFLALRANPDPIQDPEGPPLGSKLGWGETLGSKNGLV